MDAELYCVHGVTMWQLSCNWDTHGCIHALSLAGLSHEVCVSSFEENLDKALFPTPADYAQMNAASKAAAVVAGLAATRGDGCRAADLVIGSDTVVIVDGRILEKPRSEAAAFDMLSTLRYESLPRDLPYLCSSSAPERFSCC